MKPALLFIVIVLLLGAAYFLLSFRGRNTDELPTNHAEQDSGPVHQSPPVASQPPEHGPNSPRETMAWPKQLDPVDAKALSNTSAVAANATVSTSSIPTLTITGLKPLLECEPNTVGSLVNFNFHRNGNGIEALLWDQKMSCSLKIFSNSDTLLKGPQLSELEFPFFLEASTQPTATKFNGDFLAGFSNTTNPWTLVVKSGDRVVKTPWLQTGKILGASYYFVDYPVAVCLKIDIASMQAESIMVFRRSEAKFLGEIPLPDIHPKSAPQFLLDPETDALICIDSKVTWLIFLDLSSLIDPRERSKSGSWPRYDGVHGWRGNQE